MKAIRIKIINVHDDTSVEFCAPSHQTIKQAIENRSDLDFGVMVSPENFDVYDSRGAVISSRKVIHSSEGPIYIAVRRLECGCPDGTHQKP